MIGTAGIARTTLVSRFVEGVLSERSRATIGANIDRKSVKVGIDAVHMVLWDITGEADISSILLRRRLNSADQWGLARADVTPLASGGRTIVRTSAANGLGVEDAFLRPAAPLLPEPV